MRPAQTTVEGVPVAVHTARASLWTLVLLSIGHFFVDLYSSALGALQPLLVERFRLSLTQVGILGGVLVFSSSVTQPLYGFLSDRFRTRLFAALSPAVAAVFISALGLAPGFPALLAMVFLGGAGIAAFHPQGTALATAGSTGRRGRAMAIFASAGTLGYSLGPTYFSMAVASSGLTGIWWAALPGVAATAFLLRRLPSPEDTPGAGSQRGDWRALLSVWRPLTILYLLVFLRSVNQITFAQLLPLYLHRERGYSVAAASYTLSAYLFLGALGGFLGGHLADRIGGRRVILISMAGATPLLALFYVLDGPLSIACLVLGGLVLLFTIPVNVVMAQELIPSQAGTVSALMMGFAWGLAGLIFIPLTGYLADLFSMHYALAALTLCPLVGFLLALRLPK